jgi:hypothetical protein
MRSLLGKMDERFELSARLSEKGGEVKRGGQNDENGDR